MRLPFAFLIGLVIFASAGCSTSLKDAVVGRYRCEIDTANAEPGFRSRAQQIAMGASGWSVDVRRNGTADLNAFGQDQTLRWKLEDRIMKVSAQDGEEILTFEVRDGGQKLVPILKEDMKKFLQGVRFWFTKE